MSRAHTVCGGCGWSGDEVELGGIYHCPNRFCLATGAWSERLKAGYQDEAGRVTEEMAARMLRDCGEARRTAQQVGDFTKAEIYETRYRRIVALRLEV